MGITGQRALIVGGSSGIGEAIAARFAAEGAEVVIAGRSAERLAAAADKLAAAGTPVTWRALDATAPDRLAEFFADSACYDHLVLTLSGRTGAGPFATLDLGELRGGFEAKTYPQLAVVQAALPRLSRTASVTFLSAASARAALPGTAGLAAINGAIEAAVPPLAAELAPIRVNAISPGMIETPWWDGVPAQARAEMFASHAAGLPVGRLGRPEEVAELAVTVAGNGFMTGSVIECGGGVQLATLG